LDSSPSPEVSIVVPLYNEEGNVEPLCRAIRDALAGWDRSYEVLLVDDGSDDGTLDRLRAMMAEDPRLRVIVLAQNSGQTPAMATGFSHAKGRILVSMDGDLQCVPADIPRMVARLDEGYDLVNGWRRDRQDPWLLRVFPSRVANWIIARVTGVPVHDNGCPLKAYRAELIHALRLYSDLHRFLPVLSSMAGARIAECVVRHQPRLSGHSKYGISRTFKVMVDLFALKMLVHFYNRPGAGFSLLALPWLLLGSASCVAWWFAVGALGEQAAVVFPSIAVMFFYLAAHLLGLAFFSEIFIARADRRDIQQLVAARPAGRRGSTAA